MNQILLHVQNINIGQLKSDLLVGHKHGFHMQVSSKSRIYAGQLG